MKIVLVPAWLSQALGRSDQPFSLLVDPMKLTDTISLTDVAFYMAMNEQIETFVPPARLMSEWRINWVTSKGDAEHRARQSAINSLKLSHRVNDSVNQGHNPVFFAEALFGIIGHRHYEEFEKAQQTAPYNLLWRTRVIDQDHIALIPELQHGEPFIYALDHLLYHAHARMGIQELAKTQLFQYYVAFS